MRTKSREYNRKCAQTPVSADEKLVLTLLRKIDQKLGKALSFNFGECHNGVDMFSVDVFYRLPVYGSACNHMSPLIPKHS